MEPDTLDMERFMLAFKAEASKGYIDEIVELMDDLKKLINAVSNDKPFRVQEGLLGRTVSQCRGFERRATVFFAGAPAKIEAVQRIFPEMLRISGAIQDGLSKDETLKALNGVMEQLSKIAFGRD